MRILGVSELSEPSAAVVVDDQVVAWVPGERLPVPEDPDAIVPEAVRVALEVAGLQRESIDVVAVSGRYRSNRTRVRPPWLRRLSEDPMSPLREGEAAIQGLLRRTGLGAFRADVEAEAREGALQEAGFSRATLRLVDVHRALSETAYRTQDQDDVRMLVVEPYGDGQLASLYAGRAGLLDQIWTQSGPDPLHALLSRIAPALRLPAWDPGALGALAARGEPDDRVVSTLRSWLGASEGHLVGRVAPTLVDPLPTLLRDVAPTDAAASVMVVLGDALGGLVRHHLADEPQARLAVIGRLAGDPRLVGAVASARPEGEVWALSGSIDAAAALGAAFAYAQPAPESRSPFAGPTAAADAEVIAARMGAGAPRLAGPLQPLLDGEGVLRWSGRAAGGPIGLGGRCVLLRADDPDVLLRIRRALHLPATVEPRLLCLPSLALGDEASGPARRVGGVALGAGDALASRVPAAVGPDDRFVPIVVEASADPSMATLLEAVGRVTGTPALLALPVVEGDHGPVRDPGSAVEVFRRAGLAALETDTATWGRS